MNKIGQLNSGKWTPLRQEIEAIRKGLKVTEENFAPVGLDDWATIEEKLYQSFCVINHYKSRPLWLWTAFKQDTCSVMFNENPFINLDKLIDESESIWFFVNETVNEKDKFWFYSGHIKAIQKIIAECSEIDEMYFASKKYEWLICINHHNCMFATGIKMPDKLKMLFPKQI